MIIARWAVAPVLLFLFLFPLQSFAQPPWMEKGESSPCGQMGWGMMGQGMGYGMGYGMGMMGQGHMMGRYGIGSGGMGMPGMMMPGSMMGGYGMLGLSEKQIGQMNAIQDDLHKKHWQLMGKMMDESIKMRDAWSVDKPDPKKIGSIYSEMAQIQRQGLEARVEAMNKMYDVLDDEQRKRMKAAPWGMRGQGSSSPMYRGGHMMMQ
jgi:Spy/CpxP family protein refolding chaperone